MMINLLQETNDAITDSVHDIGDVKFVTSYIGHGYETFSYDTFSKLAAQYNYDNGYGLAEVNESLKIVFTDNSWLERYVYDGSEYWVYKTTPREIAPIQNIEIEAIARCR